MLSKAKLVGLCDDFFDVSSWLGYSAQLFIILHKYIVHTVNYTIYIYTHTYARWFDKCYEKIIKLGEVLDT